jgi:phage head maturation protease
MDKKFYFDMAIQKSGTDQASGEFYVEGYAATCDLDRQGDIIALAALKKAAVALLETGRTVFFNHNYDRCVGKLEDATVDNVGMKVKIYVSKWEEELRQKITEGIINKFSIGGRLIQGQQMSPEEALSQFPDQMTEKPTGPVKIIRAIELFEVSIVGLPANAKAEFVHKSLYDALKEEVTKVSEVHKADESAVVLDADQIKELVAGAIHDVKKTPEEKAEEKPTQAYCPTCKEPCQATSEGVCPKCGGKVDMVEAKPEEAVLEEGCAPVTPAEEDKAEKPKEEVVEEPKPEVKPEETPAPEAEKPKPYYYSNHKELKDLLLSVQQAMSTIAESVGKLVAAVEALPKTNKDAEVDQLLAEMKGLNEKVKEIPVTVGKSTPIVTPEPKKEVEKKVEVIEKTLSPEEAFLTVIKGK